MTLEQAFQILDVAPDATATEVRRAYAGAIGRPNLDDDSLKQLVEALDAIERSRGPRFDAIPSSGPIIFPDPPAPSAFELRYGRGSPLLRVRILVGALVLGLAFFFRVFHSCADSDATLPGMTPGQSEELKRRFHEHLVAPSKGFQ